MTQLGKYDIIEEIGRGGFGVVYRVLDITLQVERALKVLHPTLTVDPQVAARFMREAQVAAGLDHPHIVPVYDIGESDGRTYLAMKFMPGGSLKDRLAAEGKLPLDQALHIISQVSTGLEAAHQRNIIHRDLKPGNILFGEFGEVRVSDFGFAKVLSETASASLTMSGGILGTPAYMAPELWNGNPPPSPATDVYALACVFYEMLTGEVLFKGDTPPAVMLKHFQELPDLDQSLAQYPSTIKQVIGLSLAKSATDRYQSASRLDEVLKQAQKLSEPDNQVDQKLVGDHASVKREPMLEGYTTESTHSESKIEKVNEKSKEIRKNVQSPHKEKARIGVIYKLMLPDDLTMDFVYVPAGEFWMGAAKDDKDARKNEKPLHMVYLDGYWIGKYPVTNVQYRAFVKHGGGEPPCFTDRFINQNKQEHPVVWVNSHQAKKFCQWLSQHSGKWLDLPTEAQWEKAARGTDDRRYPWGNKAPTPQLVNYDQSVGDTTSVGGYPSGASPYGVLDMAGNVWEWVADWYAANYYNRSPHKNPTGPTSGNFRVLRGGSRHTAGRYLRVSIRFRVNPDYRSSGSGFRCLLCEAP